MNEIDKRKLNLLVHLAKVDGRFVHSERKILEDFIKEKGLIAESLEKEEEPFHIDEYSHEDEKIELLYWALKVIQADDELHESEIRFCESLADKLNLDKNVVRHYFNKPVPEFEDFQRELRAKFN